MNEMIINTSSIAVTNEIDEALFSRWISYLDNSPKTIETYSKNVKQFFLFLQANSITHPTRADILNFKDMLASTRKPTTANGYLMAVKQFFKWLELEGIYPNIAKNIKPVKIDSGHKKDYLTTAQVKNLLSSVDRLSVKGLRDYAILMLMITSGLRTIEIARANLEDMRVRGNFTALYIQGKGKTDKTDFIKITEPVEKAIREYLTARGKIKDTEPLFSSCSNRDANQRMTTRSISRIAKTHLIESNLNSSRLTAHSLRHTTATLNLMAGATIEETKQLLRHSSVNTTLIYAHALERDKNNSEQRITDFIFK